jgi:hypothetical protein
MAEMGGKGRTIRKMMGGGTFLACTIFFSTALALQEFFFGMKLEVFLTKHK